MAALAGPVGRPRRAARRLRRRLWLVSPEGFRELRHGCLLSRKACAAFLGVCERTVRHWDSGRNRVLWSAVRLLRLLRCGDLGALRDEWDGWTLNRLGLHSPNGYVFQPWRMAAWPMVAEQARFWRQDYDRRTVGGVGAQPPRWRLSAVGNAAQVVQPAPAGCAGSMAGQGQPLPRRTALSGLVEAGESPVVPVGRRARATVAAPGRLDDVGDIAPERACVGANAGGMLVPEGAVQSRFSPAGHSGAMLQSDARLTSVCYQNPEFVTEKPTPKRGAQRRALAGPDSNTGLNPHPPTVPLGGPV